MVRIFPSERPSHRRSLALAATLQCVLLATSAWGQQQTAPTSQTNQPAQTDQNQPATTPPPKGKVLFERHEALPDDSSQAEPAETPSNGQSGNGVSSSSHRPRTMRRRTPDSETQPADAGAPAEPAAIPAPQPIDGSKLQVSSSSSDDGDTPNEPLVLTEADAEAAKRVSDAERAAVQVTATDLDLHLNTHTGAIEAHARLTLRNTSSQPLAQLPLRVSGALHWDAARLVTASGSLPLDQHRLPDDLDHTGLGSELVLKLPRPLAPGATIDADLFYSGTVTTSAQRLMALGAPRGRAEMTDWDTVSDTFTGLRGLGDVLWYPVAGPTAMLGDNADVPQAVATDRARNIASSFRLRLTVEYTGSRPDAAFFCSERMPLQPLTKDAKAENDGGVVTALWTRTALGEHTPSLFIANGAPQTVASGLLNVVTDRADTAAALGEAASRIRPMLSEWLGARPARSLDVIDLPLPGAAGFSDGSLLVAPLTTGPATALAPSLVQPLTTVWLPSTITTPWLREGIPTFMQAIWAERTSGRATALAGLAATSASLKSSEAPPPPAVSSSVSSSNDTGPAETPITPLANCIDPACTRGKAAYVLEMLRNMLGDSGLQQALSGWRVRMEQTPSASSTTETAAFESLLQQVAGKRDLNWFFRNWIDAGNSLPELSIITVAPRRVERNAPINYLPEQKKAVAGPIGAEPVPLPGDPDDVARRQTITPGDRIAPAVGSWMVAVEVQNAGSTDVEVPVTVRAGNLTNTLPLRIAAHSQATIRVPFEAEPQEVFVNDGSIPEVRTTQHRRSIGNLPAER